MRYLFVLTLSLAALLTTLPTPAYAISDAGPFAFSGTSVTVTNSQHGMGSKYYSILVYDGSGNRLQPSGSPGFTYTINPTTYALSVTFNSSTSGNIVVRGPFASHTSHSRDFAASIGVDGSGGFFKVCSDCVWANYALRSWGGKTYYAGNPSRLSLATSGGAGKVRVWLEDAKVVYGYSYTWSGGDSCSSTCELRSGVSAFPAGVVKIGECDRGNSVGTYWIENTFADLRSTN